MRAGGLLCLVLTCAVCAKAAPPQRKFESADVDRVLGNERILTNYIRCLMDEGACTQEARDLKKLLPEVLGSNCAKCSEKQRVTTQKVVRHLQTKRPGDWARLTAKYDPTGDLRNKFEQANAPSSPLGGSNKPQTTAATAATPTAAPRRRVAAARSSP